MRIDLLMCFRQDADVQKGTYYGYKSVSLIRAANLMASTGIIDSINMETVGVPAGNLY